MAKEELIQFEGLVTEILPDARYRVQLDAGHEIVAYTAGKMKKNRIKTLAGDRVTIEMSPYDLEKGRLVEPLPKARLLADETEEALKLRQDGPVHGVPE